MRPTQVMVQVTSRAQTMPDLSAELPVSVREKSRVELLANVPALVVHPAICALGEWHGDRAPALIWMHGRTAHKELDAGRYLRLVRAGIASVALDLPGHGARFDQAMHNPERTLDCVEQMASEIDGVVEAMRATQWFDMTRLAIGGMSAGGMATLVRLCTPHQFRAACVECTTGSFAWQRHRAMFEAQRAQRLDPIQHLDQWRALPLLVLHNTDDEWVAVEGQREFVKALRTRASADHATDLITMHEYAQTGAPHEHAGFGKFSSDAKDRQTQFLVRHLRDDVAR
jgi:alpha-beta hydrolase superfamily lysophospholipase